ncbi:lactadherin-like [Xenia sp. Carnegie-2017]|uniref:lactadherin-like n=1 Tax=Xenia sp. Carnegie-2017 TaxID=2897299 RepID=UPI001F040AAA|nr:lactadherin-like [Xenia sp. Carnegie-2017]
MNKLVFLLGVFILFAFESSCTICCDTLKALAEEKEKAYQVVCGASNNLQGCCHDFKNEVNTFMNSYAVLCSNSTNFICRDPKPLGMENGKIPDSAITASSEYASAYLAPFARLRNTKSLKCSWAPTGSNRMNSWHQVNFGKNTIITGVATQGSCQSNEWAKTYSISYSNDGKNWSSYKENGSIKIFQGNSDTTTVVKHSFSSPIISRFVRFVPKTYQGYPTMRIEYYGCY